MLVPLEKPDFSVRFAEEAEDYFGYGIVSEMKTCYKIFPELEKAVYDYEKAYRDAAQLLAHGETRIKDRYKGLSRWNKVLSTVHASWNWYPMPGESNRIFKGKTVKDWYKICEAFWRKISGIGLDINGISYGDCPASILKQQATIDARDLKEVGEGVNAAVRNISEARKYLSEIAKFIS